jgi:hypothetical protein
MRSAFQCALGSKVFLFASEEAAGGAFLIAACSRIR